MQRYAIDYAQYGLSRPIKYWEVGNEPDISIFFDGSKSDYNHFFKVAFNAIKSVDSTAKVGANGVARVPSPDQEYITGFLDYCNSNGIQLDFFCWHHYADRTMDPYDYLVTGNQLKKYLQNYRFNNVESFLTEWNMTANVSEQHVSAVQASTAAAFICSALAYMRDASLDEAYFYHCDGMHLGLINQEYACTCSAKAFIAFNQLRATSYRFAAGAPQASDEGGQNTQGIVVLAGAAAAAARRNVRKVNILLSNYQINTD